MSVKGPWHIIEDQHPDGTLKAYVVTNNCCEIVAESRLCADDILQALEFKSKEEIEI